MDCPVFDRVLVLIVLISLVGVIVVSNIDIEAMRATATAAAGR
jgi:hypothetical protein